LQNQPKTKTAVIVSQWQNHSANPKIDSRNPPLHLYFTASLTHCGSYNSYNSVQFLESPELPKQPQKSPETNSASFVQQRFWQLEQKSCLKNCLTAFPLQRMLLHRGSAQSLFNDAQ
jgi:hypothetical protein